MSPPPPGTPATAPPGPGRSVALLAAARGVANASLRWIPLFLPTIVRSLDTSLGRAALAMGVGELFGMTALVTGRLVQRQGTRRWLLAGLLVVLAANLLSASLPSIAAFAAGYALIVTGQSFCNVSAQSWIGRHIEPARRGRYLGAFETSWALALLIGAPLAALAVARAWRGPYVLWATAAVVLLVAVTRLLPADGPDPHRPARRADEHRLPSSGWAAVAIGGLLMAACVSIVVVSGAWLEDRFGLGARQVGAVAFVLGSAELTASVLVARVSDRWGAARSLRVGIAVLLTGLATMVTTGRWPVVAVGGLTVFVGGFEFAYIATLGLALRQPPAVIARVVGTLAAAGTLSRALGAALAGWLYARGGLAAVAALAVAAALTALATLPVVTRHERTALPGVASH